MKVTSLLFILGNALYFQFFLEKNDNKAEASLKAARVKFEEAIKEVLLFLAKEDHHIIIPHRQDVCMLRVWYAVYGQECRDC